MDSVRGAWDDPKTRSVDSTGTWTNLCLGAGVSSTYSMVAQTGRQTLTKTDRT